jgi:tRNA pseudouridine13 synthase
LSPDSTLSSAIPHEWLAAALDPPHALGLPPATGRLRVAAEDFIVEEQLGFAPDGGGAHVLLSVEKTDANTLYVARALARFAGVRAADVGFAGLKDRRAIARQWFSVPAGPTRQEWLACEGQGFRVLEASPHSRKLRRGALAGNRFRIAVRELAGDVDAMPSRLQQVAASGTPNYFGPQRFGLGGANLARVQDWLTAGRLPRDRDARSFLLSAARSLVFNAALAARVAQGSWNRLLPGEVVNLAGSGSVFLAEAVDEALAARCQALDVHPTGPLPGRGGLQPVGDAAAAENSALSSLEGVVAGLAEAGVEASRRALRLGVDELSWSIDGAVLNLSFALPRGAFATAVLREIVAFDVAGLPGGED